MPDPRYQIPEQLVHIPDIAQRISDGWLDLDAVRQLCRTSTGSRAAFMPVLQAWEVCIFDKVLPGFWEPSGVSALPNGQVCVADWLHCEFQIVDHLHAPHNLRSRPIVRMTVGPTIHRTPDQLVVPTDEDDFVPDTLCAHSCAYDGEGNVFAVDLDGMLHKFRLADGQFLGTTIEAEHGAWHVNDPVAVAFAKGHVYVAHRDERQGHHKIEVFAADLTHVRSVDLGGTRCLRAGFSGVAVHDDELYVLHGVLHDTSPSEPKTAISCFSLQGEFRRTVLGGNSAPITAFTIVHDTIIVARSKRTKQKVPHARHTGWLDVLTLGGEPALRQQIDLTDRCYPDCDGMCFDPELRLLVAACRRESEGAGISGALLVYRVV